MLPALLAALARFSYPALFVFLLASGVGAPLPEELVLIAAGALTARGVTHLMPTLITGYFGVLGGDLLLYTIGRRLGRAALHSRRFARVLPPSRAERIARRFARSGALTVFGARWVAGLRAPTFLMAGASRLRLRRFLLADAAAALATVPGVVILAHQSARRLPHLLELLHAWKLAGVALALGLAAFLLLRWRWRLRPS